MTTPASRGRATLTAWKANHVRDKRSGYKAFCARCGLFFPCDASRLIEAVEEMERGLRLACPYRNGRELVCAENGCQECAAAESALAQLAESTK